MFSDNNLELTTRVEELLREYEKLEDLNEFLRTKTGIINFFATPMEKNEFREFIKDPKLYKKNEKDLGDFQTPISLTDRICQNFVSRGIIPEAILEPTCGSGNFILSAIKFFPSLKYIYCVEIQPKYEKLFKLNLLKLSFKQKIKPVIEFHRDNIFTHEFSKSFLKCLKTNINIFLILGNPPWITNSELSVIASTNIPVKSNIKKVKGIEAITGSSNFDIAEYIISDMIQKFSFREGHIAMLCKTIVVKNLVRDIDHLGLNLSEVHSFILDSKKEFNISANSTLFQAIFGSNKTDFCSISSFYDPKKVIKKFGWVEKKFVSNINEYEKNKSLDEISIFEWRQGVKHDATKVMVLKTTTDGNLLNGYNEIVDLEVDFLYPFIKGSGLRELVVNSSQLKIIITQSYLNEDTSHIEHRFPKTWSYLNNYSNKLNGRKSKIYKNSSRFSIFGIGEYSFKPFKVAIAGFYKEPIFSLIFPIDNKPIMLDDTCYQLAFENLEAAFFTWILLNLADTKNFLSSIVFLDAKRPYTKKVLMRIGLSQLIKQISFSKLKTFYEQELENEFHYNFSEKDYFQYLNFYKR
jgi:hypothetical protein